MAALSLIGTFIPMQKKVVTVSTSLGALSYGGLKLRRTCFAFMTRFNAAEW